MKASQEILEVPFSLNSAYDRGVLSLLIYPGVPFALVIAGQPWAALLSVFMCSPIAKSII